MDCTATVTYTHLCESTEPFADLPQLQGHTVVSAMGAHILRSAAGEVTPAERFDSFLQGAVQCGLSSCLRVQEQQPGNGLDENLLPQADVPGQLSANNTCRGRGADFISTV